MRIRPLVFPVVLLPLLFASAHDASAMGGIEGTFEWAIDAPWRVEPVMDAQNRATYGAIPIQLTVLDENAIPLDSYGLATNTTIGAGGTIQTNRMIGNFCGLVIAQGNVRRHIDFKDLVDVETTGNASTTWQNGAWQPGKGPPPHARCQPATQDCTSMVSPHGTSEWYATAWYTPTGTLTPGSDVPLTAVATFTRTPATPCAGAKTTDLLTLTNSLSIHLGDAPLPRFHDNRWAYGDLHFHGQGTDNEGESGYNYRGVIRAMGAMGMDFVLATEHASDSTQILDVDYNGVSGAVFDGHVVGRNGSVLRDMSAQRFSFLHGELWASDGVNKVASVDGRTLNNVASRPQNVLSHGLAPQIFIGGEVDAMPEIEANFPSTGSFQFGNGIAYDLKNLCGGWQGPVTSCSQGETVQQDQGVTILKDVQGYDSIHPARVHMVYMPKDPTNKNGFVSSRTGVFGGASRHLTRGSDGVFPEMEGNGGVQKGYTFLAHPVPGGSCGGGTPDMSGGPGPDVIPYTQMMLEQAFRSKAVLGLELWNEDIRMKSAANTASTKEIGYESSWGMGGHGMRNDDPKGFLTGAFTMYPWAKPNEPGYQTKCTSMEWTLHHGLKEWDNMMMRGIHPGETASLAWVPAGDPRRVYMAGGSDAHGDLNYHRAGYMLGMEQVDDMGLGKPRNLVFGGVPETTVVSAAIVNREARVVPAGSVQLPNNDIKAHSQTQILNGLINGAFSVTDGPVIRIGIDRNGNGAIDDGDIPMGGIVELYGEKTLPLLVEWDSTPEWGPVGQIDIVMGAINTNEPAYQVTFAPVANGPRSAGTPSFAVARTRPAGGHTINDLADGYTQDPTGLLRFSPNSLSGHKRIDLPLTALTIGENHGAGIVPNRMYLRAFARSTVTSSNGQCAPDPKIGQCILRYGFSNPVWAITPTRAAGVCPKDKLRSIDSDGDGSPDGCDPCPGTKSPVCAVVLPNGGQNKVGP